jgi:two-component system chemotaxis sensor kinase CheA
MSQDLGDLLPLFLSEARDRLEKLSILLGSEVLSVEDGKQARRELHALKGASRMMRLTELSELCHQAEELLDPPRPEQRLKWIESIDRLAACVAELERATSEGVSEPDRKGPPATSTTGSSAPARDPQRSTAEGDAELRVTTQMLDVLTDRSARLRVLAVAASNRVERLFQLARLAQSGVSEASPQQVLATLSTSLRQIAIDSESEQRRLERLADRQLEALLRLQVQPLRPFLLSLARHARELARAMGKEIEVAVESQHSHLDRRIIDALREAFVHLVRNAVDHGIEDPGERQSRGKPRTGHLRLEAWPESNRVRIVVSDDGAGIDPETVRHSAARFGMLDDDEAARLTRDECLQLVCQPGFSTREQATELSGRGVGLDAVASAVRGIGGSIWLDSQPRQGTTITLDVPVSRRGERILVLEVGQSRLAIPSSTVRSFGRVEPESLVCDGDGRFLKTAEGLLPVHVLAEILGEESAAGQTLIEAHCAGSRIALVVDAVVGEEEVFLRPLSPRWGVTAVFDGMAVLGSGRPVPVLATERIGHVPAPAGATAVTRVRSLRVLLVDDSMVTREMMRRLLEDGGFAVTAAGGAEDALKKLTEGEYDCLVTDIEMPGMDGLDLTRQLRSTPQFAHLPIVVVSTRDRSSDRLAGLEAGADAYLTKQGLHAAELIGMVQRVGGRS